MSADPTPHMLTLPHANRGLVAVFASTLFQLSGVFMLSPLLLLLLKEAHVSSTVAGLFAGAGWLGIFMVTPFASHLVRRLGRRQAMWLASGTPLLTALCFMLTDNLYLWFALELLANMAGGLRWLLAEAYIGEFAPPAKLGRYIGAYGTLVGLTLVIGPALLAWVGTDGHLALWCVVTLLAVGLAWSAWIPQVATPPEEGNSPVGLRGLGHALRQHPVVMFIGLVSGFFELGLSSILPLIGLNLALGASAAALLLAVSGVGGILLDIPAGMLADRFTRPEQGRRILMQILVACLLVSALMCAGLPHWPVLVWPVALIWGAAGGTLYILTMTDIAAREKGLDLVNSTSVLVLSYTLGALIASSSAGVLLDWSVAIAFPLVISTVALGGLLALVLIKPERS